MSRTAWIATIALTILLAGGTWLRTALGVEWSPESVRATVRDAGIWAPLLFIALVTFRLVILIPSQILLAAAGLPVVTSGAVGAAELLRDSGGVVTDPEDVTGFARELEQLQEPALRARRAADSRKVAETLSWDRQIDVLRAELERAVA